VRARVSSASVVTHGYERVNRCEWVSESRPSVGVKNGVKVWMKRGDWKAFVWSRLIVVDW